MSVILRSSPDDIVSLAVARSLGKKNIECTVFSTQEKTLATYSKYCKNSVVSPDDLDFFLTLSKDDVVFPLDEQSMLILSENREKLSCSLAFPDHRTLETVMNKSRLMHHAAEHDISCPKTAFIERVEDIQKISDLEFPVVLKPGIGSGGKGVTFIKSSDELHSRATEFFGTYGPFIVQEKIPFVHKYTVGVLCNADSDVRRACVIKELRNYPVETGPACYAETVEYPELLEISIRLMESLHYFGIADIDFLVDARTGRPTLMEINPRFWGSLQVAVDAGVDFPVLLFEMMKNGDVGKSLEYSTGVRCRHVVFDDILRLTGIIKGRYPLTYKIDAIIEFLRFHPSDGYYVFCLDDLKPFRHVVRKKILRNLKL